MDPVPLEIMRYRFASKIALHLENCPEEYSVWKSDLTIRNATALNPFRHREAAEPDSTALTRTARDKSPSEESAMRSDPPSRADPGASDIQYDAKGNTFRDV